MYFNSHLKSKTREELNNLLAFCEILSDGNNLLRLFEILWDDLKLEMESTNLEI